MNELREQLQALLDPKWEKSSIVGAVAGPERQSTPDTGGVEALRGGWESLGEELAALRRSVGDLRDTGDRQAEGLAENTRATLDNTASRGRDVAASVRGALDSTGSHLGAASALSPLVSGLIKLFRHKSEPAPQPLPVYTPPERVRLDAALTGPMQDGLAPVDYGQDGLPRRSAGVYAPQITVQVQALDSRSFLDHSDDIARAVRQAMLNMHSLNDVVGEL